MGIWIDSIDELFVLLFGTRRDDCFFIYLLTRISRDRASIIVHKLAVERLFVPVNPTANDTHSQSCQNRMNRTCCTHFVCLCYLCLLTIVLAGLALELRIYLQYAQPASLCLSILSVCLLFVLISLALGAFSLHSLPVVKRSKQM